MLGKVIEHAHKVTDRGESLKYVQLELRARACIFAHNHQVFTSNGLKLKRRKKKICVWCNSAAIMRWCQKKHFQLKQTKKNTTHFNTVAGVVYVSNSFAPFEIGSISSWTLISVWVNTKWIDMYMVHVYDSRRLSRTVYRRARILMTRKKSSAFFFLIDCTLFVRYGVDAVSCSPIVSDTKIYTIKTKRMVYREWGKKMCKIINWNSKCEK